MPQYAQDPQNLQNLNPEDSAQQQNQQPSQQQPNGHAPSVAGSNREWVPTKNQLDDLRWVVERDLRRELGVPCRWESDKAKIAFHRRQLALLEQANKAPRCGHVYSDGRCCRAPRVRKGKLCYAHTLMEARRPRRMSLPPLEDANAIMHWLMEVSRGLLEGQISERTAGLMFYGLQLAMVNARWTTFKETEHAEMVRKAPGEDRRKPLTTKDTKEHEGGEEGTGDPSGPLQAETALVIEGPGQVERSREIAGVESAKSLYFGVVEGKGEAEGDREIR